MADISEIWGLQYALDNKADSEHKHHIRGIEGLKEGLDGKADENHDHPLATEEQPGFMSIADKVKLDHLSGGAPGSLLISSIEGLSQALTEKAPTNHGHVIEQISGLELALDSKAAADHDHPIATDEQPGFMSAADKAKLDQLDVGGSQGEVTIAQVDGLAEALSGKAATNHSHAGLPNPDPQQLPYTVSQSAVDNTTSATYENLTDGSYTTGTGTPVSSTSWIQADLGSVKAITGVTVAGGTIPNGWGNAAVYLNPASIDVSLDGNNWAILVNQITQATDTSSTRFAFAGVLARYVRVRRNGNYLGLSEFRIFG